MPNGLFYPGRGPKKGKRFRRTRLSNARVSLWPIAYAGITNSPATWLALGDSITEGQGTSVHGNRWISKALNSLRARSGSPSVTGGIGWMGAASLVVGPDSAWTSPTSPIPVAGGTTTLYNYFWQTIDGKGSTTNALNDTITWSVTGTSVDTWIVDSSANGTYQIDSNSAVALSNGGSFPNLQVQHAPLGASGSHTVQLKQTNAGLIGIDGIYVYDADETNGVHLWGTGHFGALITDLLNDWGTGPASTFLAPFWSLIAPDLATIAFGTNEFLNNIDPTTFKSSVRQVIQLLQSLPKVPTIYVLALPTFDDGTTHTFRWTAYQAALSQVVSEFVDVYYLDISTITGAPTSGGLFSTDQIHPSDSGHSLIGNFFANNLVGNADAAISASIGISSTVVATVGNVGTVNPTITFTPTVTASMAATGAIGQAITFTPTVTGVVAITGTVSQAITFTPSVTGVVSAIGTVNQAITFGSTVTANVTAGAMGTITQAITLASNVSAIVGELSPVAATVTVTPSVVARIGAQAAVGSTLTFGATVTASVTTGATGTVAAGLALAGTVTAVVARFAGVSSQITFSPNVATFQAATYGTGSANQTLGGFTSADNASGAKGSADIGQSPHGSAGGN